MPVPCFSYQNKSRVCSSGRCRNIIQYQAGVLVFTFYISDGWHSLFCLYALMMKWPACLCTGLDPVYGLCTGCVRAVYGLCTGCVRAVYGLACVQVLTLTPVYTSVCCPRTSSALFYIFGLNVPATFSNLSRYSEFERSCLSQLIWKVQEYWMLASLLSQHFAA